MCENEKVVVCDEENQAVVFNSNMDALTYLSKRGWIFVGTVTPGNLIHYILKKEVSRDEDAKDGLNLLTLDEEKKARKK